MNMIIKTILLSLLAVQTFHVSAAQKPAKKTDTETVSAARKFLVKMEKVARLSNRVIDKFAPDKRESGRHIFSMIDDLAKVGLLIIDISEGKKIKTGDTSIDFGKFQTRINCLTSKNDEELKRAFASNKDALCPSVGCTSAENCYLLAFRDLIYTTQLIMEVILGKIVQTKGEELSFEPGLAFDSMAAMKPLINLTGKAVPSQVVRNMIDTLVASIESALKKGIQIQKALAPVPPAIDFLVVGLGDDLDSYIDLPEIYRQKIKLSDEDESFGDFDMDDMTDEVRRDMNDFSDLGEL